MTIAAAAESGPPAAAERVGKIDAWLAGLPEPERAAAETILNDPAWQHEQIRVLFIDNGLDVSQQSLGAYRKKLRHVAR